MSREIKFRGRTSGSNEWVYGSYQADVMHQGTHTIMYCDFEGYYMEDGVDPETVGQYTGLKDKNGKEIYEGDAVEFTVFNHNDAETQYRGVVKYRSGLYEVWKNNDSEFFESDGAFILNFVWLQDDEFTVIGNIYENPELLK